MFDLKIVILGFLIAWLIDKIKGCNK